MLSSVVSATLPERDAKRLDEILREIVVFDYFLLALFDV